MAVLRVKNSVEAYDALAADPDLHALTGRAEHRALTAFINQQIAAILDLRPDDKIVDIGCGDGSFLALIQGKIDSGLGIVPSEAELARLSSAYELPSIRFAQGLADRIPAADRSFDKIVINGVILLLEKSAVAQCLHDIKRIAKPGALVYIGEVPNCDERAAKNRYLGNSIVGFLLHKARRKGLRKALKKGFAILKDRGGAQVILGQTYFWMPPEDFTRLAVEAGLDPVRHWRHQEIDESGRQRDSSTRVDYLFRA